MTVCSRLVILVRLQTEGNSRTDRALQKSSRYARVSLDLLVDLQV